MLKKNFLPILKKLQNFLPKKLSQSSQEYGLGIRDPGSGSEIRDPEKTYSGSRIQGSKRHRIPDPGSATLVFSNPTVLGQIYHAN
jgi:hypothetical protein